MYERALHLNYTPRTKSRTYESKNVQIIGIWRLNLLIHSLNMSMLIIFVTNSNSNFPSFCFGNATLGGYSSSLN